MLVTDDSQKHLQHTQAWINVIGRTMWSHAQVHICGHKNPCEWLSNLCLPASVKVACCVGRDALWEGEALWVARRQLGELQCENIGVGVPHHHGAKCMAKEGSVRLRAGLAFGPLLGERQKLRQTWGRE